MVGKRERERGYLGSGPPIKQMTMTTTLVFGTFFPHLALCDGCECVCFFFLTTECGVDRCSVSFSHSCCTRFLSRLFINILRDRSSSSASSSSASCSSHLMLLLLLLLMYLLTIFTFPTVVALFVLWRIVRPHPLWKMET